MKLLYKLFNTNKNYTAISHPANQYKFLNFFSCKKFITLLMLSRHKTSCSDDTPIMSTEPPSNFDRLMYT